MSISASSDALYSLLGYCIRFSQLLATDHRAVDNPDVETPFLDAVDVVRRLLPYHVFQHPQEELEYATALNNRAVSAKGKGKATDLTALPPHLRAIALENEGTFGILYLPQLSKPLMNFHLNHRDCFCLGTSWRGSGVERTFPAASHEGRCCEENFSQR